MYIAQVFEIISSISSQTFRSELNKYTLSKLREEYKFGKENIIERLEDFRYTYINYIDYDKCDKKSPNSCPFYVIKRNNKIYASLPSLKRLNSNYKYYIHDNNLSELKYRWREL